MLFKFTAAGESLFQSNPSTFAIDKVVLGSSFGYTLGSPPTNIQGSAVYTSIATLVKTVVNANTIRFVKLLDNTVGDFNFGEVACYSGSTIVAVGVNPTAITKTAAGATDGNSIGLNVFLSNSNTDAYGFLQLTNSTSNLAVSQINHVDYLLPPYDGEPNIYVVNGLTPTDTPTLAFSDSYGRWNFSTKPQTYYEGVVFDSSFDALDIEDPHGVTFLSASQHFLQFISGPLRGYVRQLTSIGTDFFGWNTPFTTAPEEGDEFIIVGPQVADGGGSGDFQAKIQFKDEGSNRGGYGTVSSVDFRGSGVEVTQGYYNDITVTIGGGGSASPFIATFTNAYQSFGDFSGSVFNTWDPLQVVSTTTFCEHTTGSTILFNEAGTYKITMSYVGQPDSGSWPEGLSIYGSKIDLVSSDITSKTSSHSRFQDTGQFNQINSFTSVQSAVGVNPNYVYEVDTFIIDASANAYFSPAVYAARYGGGPDMIYDCSITIEQLKALTLT